MDINYTKEQIINYLNQNLEKFKRIYSESDFLKKIVLVAKRVGATATYNALKIYYTLKESELPVKDKILVMAALGYFIAPIDLIPDFLGVVGLTDDAIVLGWVTKKLGAYVTPEIEDKAKKKTEKIFGETEFFNAPEKLIIPPADR